MSDSPIPELDTPAALKRFAGALWRAALAAAAKPQPAQRDALKLAYHTYNVTVRGAVDGIDAGDRREALRILVEIVRPSAHCNGAELQRYAEALQPQLERIAELVAPRAKCRRADAGMAARRAKVAEYLAQGKTLGWIALELDVCEGTISRDAKYLRGHPTP